jgi:opacity protein-like surface antigen
MKSRIGFFEAAGYPLKKRFHFYVGGGPSFVWTTARSGSLTAGSTKDTNFVVGFHALAGLKYFITEKLSVFGEYKFKHWEPKAFKLGSDHFDVSSFNANLFYIGLAFHP